MTLDTPYLDENNEIENRVDDLLSRLTQKEKFMLLTSHGRQRFYITKPIKRLNIPSFKTTDGPLGVAMHSSGFKKNTRFPSTVSLASTWNRSLMEEVGVAMGKEVRAVGRHILLAPGINIARTPMNGRTFEYFSEDPYMTKEMAIPLVKGIQSQRIAACLKHYAANNQEINRMTMSAEIDERTLQETYMRAFRNVVKEADPWTFMTCYNMVNGVYGCENKYLLQENLMDEWGFDGLVMTDWLASRKVKTTEGCINAGLTLEMPWPRVYKIGALKKAYENGEFTDETLDDRVRRNLRIMMRTGLFDSPENLPKGERNTPQHQELVRRTAEEGMVLLKNSTNLLPLAIDELKTISLHGVNLKKKFGRLLNGGSSAVSPPYEITPQRGMEEFCGEKIKFISEGADVAIVFAGLNHGRGGDSESMDRKSLTLDDKQVREIKEIASQNQQAVVCLIAGSPIAMDEWIDDVEAVLMCWYGGMEAGNAIANVLFGKVNPSGKLPLTFPKQLEDSPAHSTGDRKHYPGDEEKRVYYDEGIFVGYRWFDEKDIAPLFPFGFGLGYTTFALADAHLISQTGDTLTVNVDVENTGEKTGAEVVQVYSHDIQSSVERPPKELVGFQKVVLAPSERKTIPVLIKSSDLMFYDVDSHDWKLETGEFELQIGNSSRNIHSKIKIEF
ncbi:MAG: glycoside hydrolase family 3 C-terminal domain-containing protein [Candidatus Thorarchaeota archaeon]|jgi:beta-glucosidase